MLGKTNFYTLNKVTKNDDSICYVITINKNHSIFKGHFPGNPVTPGVAQMDIVKELVALTVEKEVKMQSMPSCKFLVILNPNENADVTVELKFMETEDGTNKVSAVIRDEANNFLKMIGIYK